MAATLTGPAAPHVPNEKTRAEVSALTSFGNTQDQIASHIGISVDTLYRHYKEELENSVVRANAKVAAKLFRKAVDQDDLGAQIFWLKTRARWRERDHDDKQMGETLVEKLLNKLTD